MVQQLVSAIQQEPLKQIPKLKLVAMKLKVRVTTKNKIHNSFL